MKYELRQRFFSYPVPASGAVAVDLPPVFTRGVAPDIRVRYADGKPLPRDAKDYEIGCRWLRTERDGEFLFVIGTQWEADQIRRELKQSSTGRTPFGEESMTGFGRLR
jgi:hypothetical protein